MRPIKAYETSDGVLHPCYDYAKRHAEKMYGSQLTKMAHELVRVEKYSEMLDILDGYKESMQLLLDLAADCDVEHEESNQ
jgi:hypothetical protein